jgi:tRNA-splicing ligase RtcB
MGDRSYVVRGKGNRLALNTAPHGAGRTLSRRAGRDKYGLEDLETAMRGITWGHSADFADEHPGVYKDVDQVVKVDSADLVEVVHTLKQFVNVKGADLKIKRK